MPGPMLNIDTTVVCPHCGRATPTVPNPRVLVDGRPSVTQPAPAAISGCALPPPPAGNGPCVSAQWVMGAARITSNGTPLLLMTSQAIAAPTAGPLLPMVAQIRASGT